MKRTSPPYRADHVGSLLRPPELLQARDDHANGRIDDETLRGIEDEAIRDVVTDAAGRRSSDRHRRRVPPRLVAHGLHLLDSTGISKAPGNLSVQFHNEEGDIEFTPAAMHIDGKLGIGETIFGDATSSS